MKIELKRLSFNARLSQETNAYAADIWIDGKKVGEARNDGGGGETIIHIMPRALHEKAEAFCKAMPNEPEHDLEMNLELYIDLMAEQMIRNQEELKQYKRWCKKETVFRVKGDPAGEWRTIKKQPYEPRVAEAIRKKYADQLEEILNERFLTAV